LSRDGRFTAYERAALVNDDWGIVLHDAVTGTDTVVGEVFSNVVVSADGRNEPRNLDKTPGITDAWGTLDVFGWTP